MVNSPFELTMGFCMNAQPTVRKTLTATSMPCEAKKLALIRQPDAKWRPSRLNANTSKRDRSASPQDDM